MQPQEGTTTSSSQVIGPMPVVMQPATTANGYYDKPADRRLRPWIFIGSLLLGCIAVGMIITPLVHLGRLSMLWGIFIAGLALGFAAIVGVFAGMTLRPALAFLFQIILLIAFAIALVVLIINAALLEHNINNRCGALGASRYSPTCVNVHQYSVILYCVFGPLVVVWVPTLLLAATYFAHLTRRYRKQEYHAGQVQPVPVGSSRM